MNRKLKQQLKDIIAGDRPRPRIYVGMRNGKKCYVRNHSLSYFQMLEKRPPPFLQLKMPKPRHVFQKQHHLMPRHLREAFWDYVIAGSIAALVLLTIITYTYVGVRNYQNRGQESAEYLPRPDWP